MDKLMRCILIMCIMLLSIGCSDEGNVDSSLAIAVQDAVFLEVEIGQGISQQYAGTWDGMLGLQILEGATPDTEHFPYNGVPIDVVITFENHSDCITVGFVDNPAVTKRVCGLTASITFP